jgi:hypothetical protein
MRLDNSAFSMYMKCPLLYKEKYEATDFVERASKDVSGGDNGGGDGGASPVASAIREPVFSLPVIQPGIELIKEREGLDFGTRFHQLLHERRRLLLCQHPVGEPPKPAPEWPDEAIEAEAQATLAAYEAHYIADCEYLESERTHILDLPARCPDCWRDCSDDETSTPGRYWCKECQRAFNRHKLIVKLDAVVRHGDGTIGPFDTKTESKPGYNTREDWAGRTQAKIYLYALGALYPNERVSRLIVDVVTRGSPKARRGPVFYRHDDIGSTPEAIGDAVRNFVRVASLIEEHKRTGWWPSNMNVCKKGWERCDLYDLHILGRTEKNLAKFRPAEQYLEI